MDQHVEITVVENIVIPTMFFFPFPIVYKYQNGFFLGMYKQKPTNFRYGLLQYIMYDTVIYNKKHIFKHIFWHRAQGS